MDTAFAVVAGVNILAAVVAGAWVSRNRSSHSAAYNDASPSYSTPARGTPSSPAPAAPPAPAPGSPATTPGAATAAAAAPKAATAAAAAPGGNAAATGYTLTDAEKKKFNDLKDALEDESMGKYATVAGYVSTLTADNPDVVSAWKTLASLLYPSPDLLPQAQLFMERIRHAELFHKLLMLVWNVLKQCIVGTIAGVDDMTFESSEDATAMYEAFASLAPESGSVEPSRFKALITRAGGMTASGSVIWKEAFELISSWLVEVTDIHQSFREDFPDAPEDAPDEEPEEPDEIDDLCFTLMSRACHDNDRVNKFWADSAPWNDDNVKGIVQVVCRKLGDDGTKEAAVLSACTKSVDVSKLVLRMVLIGLSKWTVGRLNEIGKDDEILVQVLQSIPHSIYNPRIDYSRNTLQAVNYAAKQLAPESLFSAAFGSLLEIEDEATAEAVFAKELGTLTEGA